MADSSSPKAWRLVACCWGLTVAWCSVSHGQVPEPEYEFIPAVDRWVSINRGDDLLIGKLDKNGDFNQAFRYPLNAPLSGGLPPTTRLTNGSPRKAYEYRSGGLIPGTLSDTGFVPEIDAKVISFPAYRYSPSAPPIWNLPGFFRAKSVEKK
jgi:hypothetical protein